MHHYKFCPRKVRFFWKLLIEILPKFLATKYFWARILSSEKSSIYLSVEYFKVFPLPLCFDYFSFISGVQLGGRGQVTPALFENWKSALILGPKGPNCIHPYIKFSIKKVVWRVSKRKNSNSLQGLFFLCFWRDVYLSALNPWNFSKS